MRCAYSARERNHINQGRRGSYRFLDAIREHGKKQDGGTRKLALAAGERALMCRCIASLTDQ